MKTFINQCREKLVALYPELDVMVNSLVTNNPEYYYVAAYPASIIQGLCPTPEQLDEALKGYIRFCDTFKQKQLDFARNLNSTYAHQDYDEVNREVYQNESYMTHTYYPALLFSYLFSSNYYEILRVLVQHYLPLIKNTQGSLCEIGIGHGMLSGLALQNNPGLKATGVDISPVAVAVTSKVSAQMQVKQPEVIIADATLDIPVKNNAAMICAEVLEHLPKPQELLKQAYLALDNGGLFFLTASINMESVDHLYLFHNDDEVIEMVQQAGFEVVEKHLAFLTAYNYRTDEALAAKLKKRNNPSTSILILRKK
ncbi:MAG TPA: class I SAM-dependent methyltransferase [Bacteroidia bacterium]|nr:class I SAM-dependent methyltransferase [Bacteroidia bacterium]